MPLKAYPPAHLLGLTTPVEDFSIPEYARISKVTLDMGIPYYDFMFWVCIDSFEGLNHLITSFRFFDNTLDLLAKETISLDDNP